MYSVFMLSDYPTSQVDGTPVHSKQTHSETEVPDVHQTDNQTAEARQPDTQTETGQTDTQHEDVHKAQLDATHAWTQQQQQEFEVRKFEYLL